MQVTRSSATWTHKQNEQQSDNDTRPRLRLRVLLGLGLVTLSEWSIPCAILVRVLRVKRIKPFLFSKMSLIIRPFLFSKMSLIWHVY